MMNPEIKAEWLAALRSGEYRQERGQLRSASILTEDKYGYCCLGVLCDLFVKPGEGYWDDGDFFYGEDRGNFENVGQGCLPENLAKEAGLSGPNPGTSLEDPAIQYARTTLTLAELNDTVQLTFDQIADVIDWEF